MGYSSSSLIQNLEIMVCAPLSLVTLHCSLTLNLAVLSLCILKMDQSFHYVDPCGSPFTVMSHSM